MKIFIVDDDVELRMIMADHLSNPRDSIREFADGQEVLAGMGDDPDLILLDIEMPKLDGIATCRALREKGHDRAQVVFVSSHDDMQTRLSAYAAGGSDFVVKPFVPADLLAKVEVARGLQARHASFVSDIQLAHKTAFTAMSSMGELGVVLAFLQASFACRDLDAIAAAMLHALEQYGLAGTVELRAGDTCKAYSSQGTCTPLERSVLLHAQKMERIFRFSSQMAVNYPQVTVVVMNLPDDEERIGRLRDHLALLAEGANSRVLALLDEQMRMAQSRAVLAHTKALRGLLDSIDKQQTENRMRLLLLGDEYLNELARAFVSLELGESQEASLYDLAKRANDRYSSVIDAGNDIAAQLREIAKGLGALT